MRAERPAATAVAAEPLAQQIRVPIGVRLNGEAWIGDELQQLRPGHGIAGIGDRRGVDEQCDRPAALLQPWRHLRTLAAAVLYPGVAWVEGANLSVGRGTDRPFEWVGAPWIESARWLQAVRAQSLPGLGFDAIGFQPSSGPYRGERCQGLQIRLLDRDRIDAPLLGLALVRSLSQLWPTTFQLDRTLALIGSADVLQGLRDGLSLQAVAARWQAPLDAFLDRRQPNLLY